MYISEYPLTKAHGMQSNQGGSSFLAKSAKKLL